jgi:hypothetical protein
VGTGDEFKGNGSKKSANFHLLGNEQKLVYTYHSNNPYNGIFAVYVVDKGADVMKTGGFPEMTIDKLKDNSESAIQKETGDYYLNVTAVGNWTIKVMEIQ